MRKYTYKSPLLKRLHTDICSYKFFWEVIENFRIGRVRVKNLAGDRTVSIKGTACISFEKNRETKTQQNGHKS